MTKINRTQYVEGEEVFVRQFRVPGALADDFNLEYPALNLWNNYRNQVGAFAVVMSSWCGSID
jgi:hypothetical protein